MGVSLNNKSDRWWFYALGAAALLHIGTSLAAPTAGWVTSLGCGAFLLIALVRCLDATREDADRAAQWRLLALTFGFWIAAFVSIAWTQSVLQSDSGFALFDSLLFMARGAPLLWLLVYDPASRTGRFKWLDAVQSLLFIVMAALLLFPGLAGGAGSSQTALPDLIAFNYRTILNIGISVFAAICWFIQRTPADRRFIATVALTWTGYTVVSMVLNAASDQIDVFPGSPFWWPLDLIPAGFVIATLYQRAHPLPDRMELARDISAAAMRRFAPSLFTALMLIMSMGIAYRTPATGLAVAIVAVGLYGLRSMMLQVRFAHALDRLETANETMARLATRDHLTGLANRRVFDEALTAAWAAMREGGEAFSLLMIDIDAFKAYNEVAGSPAGDHCLQQCAWVLQAELGSGDVLARYGGAEFVVLARHATLRGAINLAERLRGAIVDQAIPHDASHYGIVTVSIGVAVAVAAPGDRTARALLIRVDDALARAKAKGRNRVETAAWPLAVNA